MAIVQGIREKVHLPIYDSVRIAPEEQLHQVEKSGTLRFFVNVQNKTKLETNLQSASLLPHYNTFEARAMRVVISDMPAEFPDDREKGPLIKGEEFTVENEHGVPMNGLGQPPTDGSTFSPATAGFSITLARAVELLREADDSEDGYAELPVDDEDVEVETDKANVDAMEEAGGAVWLSVDDLEELIDEQLRSNQVPLPQQVYSGNGSGNLIGTLIFNTVTSLYVGEKLMIQMPTWFFPGGAGPYSEQDHVTTHGTPSPLDTFRFAEPIFIDKQQNFRVEIEIPDTDMLKELQRIYGPLYIWVVLDGYMERGVQ
jgi:hypothetical protein